ncbi:MAG: PP2C family protein-serine/threonine phosphatase [Cyanobacteria bacterium P01_H01_bin.130]
MPAAPVPPASPNPQSVPRSPQEPIFALKELVAQLSREQNKVQDLLSSLGFALRSFKNINQFLELIPLIAGRVCNADGGALLLFRASGQIRLEQLHCTEEAGAGMTQTMRRSLEMAARQATGALTANAHNLSPSELGRQAVDVLEVHAQALIPDVVQLHGVSILVNGVERGRLYIFGDRDQFSLTDTRHKLLCLVADQTAVAIDNDELNVELKRKERLDRELEIGAEIQVRLLPRRPPKIQEVAIAARCQTAHRVGGDYYDFIPQQHDQHASASHQPSPTQPWGIAIGDVMGKGVPAGLIMTMTRGMLRAEVLNGHSPARILHHLNRVMYADLENSHRFVTLFYSEYDPTTKMLAYSNAAHNPPLIWRAQERSLGTLDTSGMLIGLAPDSQYEDKKTRLHPGDTVVYYTDGLTDVANPKGERFEEERLVAAIEELCAAGHGAEAILNQLFERVQKFMGPELSNGDDMTAVVIQIQPDGTAETAEAQS